MATEAMRAPRRRATTVIGEWAGRLRMPVADPRFWVIQALVLGIDTTHTALEDVQVLVSDSELYLMTISVLLIPAVYAAMSFGLRGAAPTVVWALILSIPEISHHNWTTRIGIFVQFSIVLAIAVTVAVRVDREKAAASASERANQRLARLNRTASAVADSLELDHVLRGTLRTQLDPHRAQIVWIRLVRTDDFPELTLIDAAQITVPAELDTTQERLSSLACLTGELQRDTDDGTETHTLVAPLKSDARIVGAIGLTQPSEAISADESQVLTAIANQLSVALNNISSHERNREALESLKAAKQNLEVYVELATEAQEEERKRVSRELHDDILQSLVVVKGQVESACAQASPDLGSSRLPDALRTLVDAIANLRRYAHDLRPSLLDDLGLVDALDWLVGDLDKRTALTVDLETSGALHRLSSRDELLIFRIVQEALHNVEHHANATHVRVRLSYRRDVLKVSVADNGRGMQQPGGDSIPRQPDHGLGLLGMAERAKLLRGTLTIRTQPGEGTELLLDVPLSPAEQTQVRLDT